VRTLQTRLKFYRMGLRRKPIVVGVDGLRTSAHPIELCDVFHWNN